MNWGLTKVWYLYTINGLSQHLIPLNYAQKQLLKTRLFLTPYTYGHLCAKKNWLVLIMTNIAHSIYDQDTLLKNCFSQQQQLGSCFDQCCQGQSSLTNSSVLINGPAISWMTCAVGQVYLPRLVGASLKAWTTSDVLNPQSETHVMMRRLCQTCTMHS